MPWFEDEQFWETFYPALFPAPRFESAQDEIDQLIHLSGVSEGAALDLCCGPGRHSKALASRGFQVTGVDRSPYLLSKARENVDHPEVKFVQSDMRAFVRPFAYDLVVNLMTSFGYFESMDQDLAVLKCIKTSLAPGGVLILDLVGKEYMAQVPDTEWRELPDGRVLIEHREIRPNWSRTHNTWLLVDPEGKTERAEFDLNLYSGIELVALMANAGFTDVEIFGSMDGAPYDASAERLIVRARQDGG